MKNTLVKKPISLTLIQYTYSGGKINKIWMEILNCFAANNNRFN